MSTIAENIAAIRARIDAAARTTGRTGADITLVAPRACARPSPPGSTPAARTACRK